MENEFFSSKETRKLQEEAKQRWGHTEAYKQSAERVKNFTKEDWDRIGKQGDALMKEIAANMDKGLASPEVQESIARHYNNLRNFYEPNLEMYRGLGEMYAADERFGKYFNQYATGMAEFMRDAMLAYCDSEQKRQG